MLLNATLNGAVDICPSPLLSTVIDCVHAGVNWVANVDGAAVVALALVNVCDANVVTVDSAVVPRSSGETCAISGRSWGDVAAPLVVNVGTESVLFGRLMGSTDEKNDWKSTSVGVGGYCRNDFVHAQCRSEAHCCMSVKVLSAMWASTLTICAVTSGAVRTRTFTPSHSSTVNWLTCAPICIG